MGDVPGIPDTTLSTVDASIYSADRTKAVDVVTDNGTERLAVDANISGFNPAPGEASIPIHQHVENGGSKEMAVDGSSTAVTFTAGPSTTNEVWFIDEIALYLEDPGSMTYNNFGAIAGGLTNGLDFKVKIGGTTYTVEAIMNNVDLFENFTNLNLSAVAGGFFNTTDMFAGVRKFVNPLRLDQADGDEIQFVVNDDLTRLITLQVALNGWRSV